MPFYRNSIGRLPASGQTTVRINGDSADNGNLGFKPNPRFVQIGDGGIVYDRATDRMWVKDPRRIVPTSPTAATVQRARGAWAGNTAYAQYDLITIFGLFYVCLVAHTAGVFNTELNAGKWILTTWPTTATSLTGAVKTACFANAEMMSSVKSSQELHYGGFADWRLPTQLELASLVDWELNGLTAPSGWFYPDSIVAPNNVNIWTCNVLANDADQVLQFAPEAEFTPAHQTGAGAIFPVRGG